MSIDTRLCFFLLLSVLYANACLAQGYNLAAHGGDSMYLDVNVTSKSGAPITDLQQQDFRLLDNKGSQTITSFRSITSREADLNVILLIDAVNTEYENVAYERLQIDRFLRSNSGHMAFPTALAIFADTGTRIQEKFSLDGSALSAALDQSVIGLRALGHAGLQGEPERFQLSIEEVLSLGQRFTISHILQDGREIPRPGRKIVLWVSPGWHLLSGPNVNLDSKQQQDIFEDIVSISAELRHAGMTLYSIDPLGMADMGMRTSYYKTFVKGVAKPSEAYVGDLALQVLAAQSGGLVLNAGNDTAALLQEAMRDAGNYYEISFNPPPSDKPNEYHHIEVKLAKTGLIARTRDGYYSPPSAQ
jgi:VWFA-related protein